MHAILSPTSAAAQGEAPGGTALAAWLSSKYPDRITGTLTVPGQAGSFMQMPDDLPEPLVRALASRGLHRLYSHQAGAWRKNGVRDTSDPCNKARIRGPRR